MVASTKGRRQMLAFALLLIGSIINAGVTAQDEEVVTGTLPTVVSVENVGGDVTTESPAGGSAEQTTAAREEAADTGEAAAVAEAGDEQDQPAAPGEGADQGAELTAEVQTDGPEAAAAETSAPQPARGDGPNNIPRLVPQDDVVCVSKEAVQDKNAVNLKLKASSNCRETKMKIESVLQELCGDCKLEIYQEENSDEILVAGQYVEEDVTGMANKFNNDNIKDKTDVEEAHPHWGKNSKLVLVSLLLTGLLLAALLVAGYYLKTHRKNSKGVRLAESFQVDEENQANTLVSVAPLPQEPLDKPTINGESPPENGNNPAPTTNGHSATPTPVADTEM